MIFQRSEFLAAFSLLSYIYGEKSCAKLKFVINRVMFIKCKKGYTIPLFIIFLMQVAHLFEECVLATCENIQIYYEVYFYISVAS